MKALYDHQSGNILFLILIAVALFAALSYVVAQSTRSGPTAGNEKLALIASQMVQSGVSARTTVMRMITMGIAKPEQLDFWNPVSAYSVYGRAGGGTLPLPPILDAVNTAQSTNYSYFGISDGMSIADIGTSAPEVLMMFYLRLTPSGEALCRAINQKLGIEGIPGSGPYMNWFLAAPGQPVACVQNFSNFYVFYFALYET